MLRSEIRSLLIALGLLPAYLILLMVGRYAVNAPYWDDWYILVYFWVHPDASVWEYWKLYNGHRAIIPKVFGLFLSTLTNLNITAPMLVALAFAVFSFGMLYRLFRQQSNMAYIVAIPFGLLIFSISQWPFWIIASSLATQLVSLCSVAAIWALNSLKIGWRALLLAALLTFIGSLTLFPGNLMWLVGLLLMWLVGYRKRAHYLLWIIMAASVLIPFAAEYLTTPSSGAGLGSLSLIAHFVLAFIGSALSFGESSASGLSASAPMGLFGLIALPILAFAVIQYVEDGFRKVLPWLAISAWVILTGVFSALGRVAEFGPLLGRAYRYTPYSALYWVCIVALIVVSLTEPQRTNPFLRAAPIGFVLLIGFGYANSVLAFTEGFDAFNQVLSKGSDCLQSYQTASDECLKNLDPFPEYIRGVMPTLIERHASFTRGMQFPIDGAQIDTPFKENTSYQVRPLDGVRTRVLFQHPPSSLTWTLNLRAGTRISFVTGIMVDTPIKLDADPSDGALFIIRITGTDGLTKELFRRLALPRKPGQDFDPVTIDLTAYAGQTIQLTLATAFGLDDKATSNYDWAMWSLPELDYR